MIVRQISITELEANPFQYRTEFPKEEIEELAASIKAKGVKQPLLVRPITKRTNPKIKYQIVAGERRYRASLLVGLKTVPAVVEDMDDIEALSMAIVENVQRKDPDDWATASGLKHLQQMSAKKGKPLSDQDLADKIGKSKGYVRNHLNLFKLRPALQEVAQEFPRVKSSLFEVQKVKDPGLEEDLLDEIKAGTSFAPIKARVDAYLENEKLKKESTKAPDTETSQRSQSNAATGGGNVSRGHQVKGNTSADAIKALTGSFTNIDLIINNMEEWIDYLTDNQKKRLAKESEKIIERLRINFPAVPKN